VLVLLVTLAAHRLYFPQHLRRAEERDRLSSATPPDNTPGSGRSSEQPQHPQEEPPRSVPGPIDFTDESASAALCAFLTPARGVTVDTSRFPFARPKAQKADEASRAGDLSGKPPLGPSSPFVRRNAEPSPQILSAAVESLVGQSTSLGTDPFEIPVYPDGLLHPLPPPTRAGVVVLSEFTTASFVMNSQVPVCPFGVDTFAEALDQVPVRDLEG
jgi:hypothetical protein